MLHSHIQKNNDRKISLLKKKLNAETVVAVDRHSDFIPYLDYVSDYDSFTDEAFSLKSRQSRSRFLWCRKMLNILRHGEKTEYRGPLVLMAVLCLCNATSHRLRLEAQNETGGVSTQNPFAASLALGVLCQLNVTFLICYMVQALVFLYSFVLFLTGSRMSDPLCVYPHSRMNHNPIKRRRGQGRKGIKNNPIK